MKGRRSGVFLERQSYRQRRLVDWLRILPIIGLLLWLVPLLWPTGWPARVSTADAIVYIFVVWFGLVVVKALSARALRRSQEELDRQDQI